MNAWDIDYHAQQHQSHPVLGPATRFLQRFRDLIDNCSDGWAHWAAPVKAARKLMEMIEHPHTASPEALKKALTPIRSFCTRRGLQMPSLE